MGNPKWRYKILPKSEIDEYVQKWRDSLRIEKIHQSKPGYFLEVKTHKGFETLGRVPKSIFKWYKIVKMQTQPGFMNVSWWKFEAPTVKQ